MGKAELTGLKRCVRLGVAVSLSTTLALAFVYETPHELIGAGDFDGDGRPDVVVVDRITGKYRIGYGEADGSVEWIRHRLGGVQGATGLGIGRVVDTGRDSMVLAAADDNLLTVLDAADRAVPTPPHEILFLSLGPNRLATVPVGGDGRSDLDDLVVTSIYNDPTPNLISLFRNTGGDFDLIEDLDDEALVQWVNAIALKPGARRVLAGLWRGDDGDTFRAIDFGSGRPVTVLEIRDLPANSAWATGHLRGLDTLDLLFYVPGEPTLHLVPVEVCPG